MIQKFNYHTHTYRCNHALGKDEEYIEAAIKLGLKTLGFSDHVPYPKDDGGHSRMKFKQLEEYLSTMNQLKEKYQSIIDIKIGFECEYFEEFDNYYRELRKHCDYLILGQHMGKISLNADYFYSFKEEDYINYERLVIKGLESGLFLYLCHPDVVLNSVSHIDDKMLGMFKRIFLIAKEKDIPIEINFGGLNKQQHLIDNEMVYPYPNYKIIKLANDLGCKFIFGADAHSPKHLEKFNERILYVKENILKDMDYILVEDELC